MTWYPIEITSSDRLTYIGSWGEINAYGTATGNTNPMIFTKLYNRIMNPYDNPDYPKGQDNQIITFPKAFVERKRKRKDRDSVWEAYNQNIIKFPTAFLDRDSDDIETLYNVERIYQNYP